MVCMHVVGRVVVWQVVCDVVMIGGCGVVMMCVVKATKQKAPVSYSGIQGLQKTATTYSPTVTQ
ncbi:hypothetical protein, partial [uncultured Bacteroides sp.]|uniref:hypothetical protein n=1 Tax=uncultured Bacteroides sp. TaxID=162156 RepID=UPI00280C0B52